MDRQRKLKLAQAIARGQMQQSEVVAVMLVGSVALGVESADSDLDIAVFSDGVESPDQEIFQREGVRIGLEFYPVLEFHDWPEVPILPRSELRNCGRFLRGMVLESRWSDLEDVRAKWRSAILHPSEALTILTIAKKTLSDEGGEPSLEAWKRGWHLQAAAFALAIVALSLAPCRFQKPKWLARDLAECGPASLLRVLRILCSSGCADEAQARRATEAAAWAVEEGCRVGSLPALSFDVAIHDSDAISIYRTYRDASSLLRDGDWEGAIYTSFFCIRMMHSYLRGLAARKAQPSPEEASKWADQAIKGTRERLGAPTRAQLEQAVEELWDIAHSCKAEYLKRASSVQMSQGQAETLGQVDALFSSKEGWL
ncbi:MAG TPA: nucleotidyltransferase domain-containing protein [Acidobacteriota bacterium]|nr:nucleotidyltransferase domain-containing protein [Acidobacteriota bacterium]